MWRWAEDLLVTKLKFFIISGLENKFSCPLSSPHLLLLSRSSWSFVGSDITRCVTPQTPFSFFFPVSSSVSWQGQQPFSYFFSFLLSPTASQPTFIYSLARLSPIVFLFSPFYLFPCLISCPSYFISSFSRYPDLIPSLLAPPFLCLTFYPPSLLSWPSLPFPSPPTSLCWSFPITMILLL